MANKKIYSAQELNTAISKIEQRGFTPKTQKYDIQSSFPAIVIDNALPNAGRIRTFSQTKAFLKQVAPKTADSFTIEQYEAQIKQLNKQLGAHRTYRGEILAQRHRLNNIIYDLNEKNETYFNPKEYSVDELYKAVKEAARRSKEDGKSDYFYEYLEEELAELD